MKSEKKGNYGLPFFFVFVVLTKNKEILFISIIIMLQLQFPFLFFFSEKVKGLKQISDWKIWEFSFLRRASLKLNICIHIVPNFFKI